MSDPQDPHGRNIHNVRVGQTWQDNDKRNGLRQLEILEVDTSYYPSGRARCKLLGERKKGQREIFYVRLNRFGNTQRGYKLLKDEHGNPVKPAKKKAKKKTAKKKAKKRKGGAK